MDKVMFTCQLCGWATIFNGQKLNPESKDYGGKCPGCHGEMWTLKDISDETFPIKAR